MNVLRQAFYIAQKDLMIELRTRRNFLTTLFFAFLIMVIFNFVFEPGSRTMYEVSPAILWVSFIFAGMLSIENAFTMEKEEECQMGLLLAPIERGVIYLGKFFSNLIFLLMMEILIIPIYIIFFNVSFKGHFFDFVLVTLLVNVGFVSVGTLFAAMTASVKTREALLPILIFPVIIPIVIAGVKATSTIVVRGANLAAMIGWFKILAGFDLIFVVVCYYVFRYVVEETS